MRFYARFISNSEWIVWTGFAMRPAGYSSCLMTDPLSLRPVAGPDPKDAVQIVHVDADDPNRDSDILDNGHAATNADEASIIDIDAYFGLHDVTTTSGSGDVMIPRAHWPEQPTTTPISGSAVTQQPRLFASGEEIRNREYYRPNFESQAEFADVGAYGASSVEARPPPSYPKRENTIDEDTDSGSGNGNIPRKLYTGSYSSADAYFAQYGVGTFPVLIDQGQYGGGVATSSVLNDVGLRQQYYLSANGTTTGNGNTCAAGYLSVDVGGFGPTTLRPFEFQSTAWPAAFRQ